MPMIMLKCGIYVWLLKKKKVINKAILRVTSVGDYFLFSLCSCLEGYIRKYVIDSILLLPQPVQLLHRLCLHCLHCLYLL